MSTPTYLLEINWAGAAWTDESQYMLLDASGSYGLVSPFTSLGDLGHAPVAEMTVRMKNTNGRYSVSKAASQAATNGIYQKKIRFSAGYSGGANSVMFIGRIQDVKEDDITGLATLECKGYDHDIQQQRPSTEAYGDGGDAGGVLRTDQILSQLCTKIGFSGTSLERGYCLIPWWYGDEDDCLAEMKEVAESEAGVAWVDPQTGTLNYWRSDYWVGAGTAGYLTRSNIENLEPVYDYANTFDIVTCHYQPRRKGRSVIVYQLTTPIIVAPGGTVVEEIKLRYPVGEYLSYTANARTGGGVSLNSNLTVTIVTQNAKSWKVQFVNTNSVHAMVIDKFDITGRPIEGLPERKYTKDMANLTIQRRSDVRATVERARYSIQTLAQARLIADLKAFRLEDPPQAITFSMPADPTLNVGDVVTVNFAAAISTINDHFVLLDRAWAYRETFEDTWFAVRLSDLYAYTTISAGTGGGYFEAGVSVLGYGRLYY